MKKKEEKYEDEKVISKSVDGGEPEGDDGKDDGSKEKDGEGKYHKGSKGHLPLPGSGTSGGTI